MARASSPLIGAIALLAALAAPGAGAHALGQTYLYLGIAEHQIDARFEVTPAGLNAALGLGLDADGGLTEEALAPHGPRIAAYLSGKARLAPDGVGRSLEFVGTGLRETSIAQFVLVEFRMAPLEQPPQHIDVDYDVLFEVDPGQIGVLLIENFWRSHTFENEASLSLVFEPNSRSQRLDLAGHTILGGLLAMVRLGMQHILEGADHVMFLAALLLPAVVRREEGRWRQVESFRLAFWHVVKIVTVFTVAHSITLSLAALELLNVPPRLVESVIAASIALAALDVFFPVFGRGIWLVVFGFGLFHGAGFASILLSMRIHPDYTVLTLLGFNVGVEIGQVIVVALIFPLLYLARGQRLYVGAGMPAAAALLIAVSAYWFVERAFDVDLPAGEYAHRLLAIFT